MRSARASTPTTGDVDLRTAVASLRGVDALTAAVGAVLTLAFAYEASLHGGTLSLGLIIGIGLFLGAVYAFLVVPHIAVAATIPIFAFLPAAKIFVSPLLGPTKDVIGLAAITAGIPLLALRHRLGRARAADRWLLIGVGLLVLLYIVNVAGRHNVAWAQGVRLASEPLLLLVAGLGLEQPRRTLRWAVTSLIVTGCVVAFYGLVQQVLGEWRLVSYGYSFSMQVRTIGGHLRSFGTLDEPFGYAAFLMLSLAALVFTARRTVLSVSAAMLLLAGVATSYVRTAVLIAVALVALDLARRRRVGAAVAVSAAVVAAAVAILVQAQGTQSRTYQSSSAVLTLNGRTSAWKTALGSPTEWALGRGVGEVGTAANRARYAITQSSQSQQKQLSSVDSGYLATVADVGLVGLVVLLGLFGRAIALGRAAALRGESAGWLILALFTVVLIDALTRASFTGFPSAFLALLIVGLALAAADEPRPSARSA